MILAAVAGPGDGKQGSSPGGDDDSESGDGFDDDGSGDDFDEDSDSDSPSEDDADDDDDNEESLHPDDPDYDGGAGSKRKRHKAKAPRGGAKKSLVQKPKKKKPGKVKPASKKARTSATAKARQAADIDEDDDGEREDIFVHEYDEHGYGDAADRARMDAMNMMERETILTERVDQRNEKHKLWLMTRQMKNDAAKKTTARSSGRTKPVKARTDAALEGLRSDKAAKKESATRRANLDDIDDESDDGQTKRRQKADANEDDAESADGADGDLYSKRMSKEESPMQYEDLVVPGLAHHGEQKGEPTHLFLPRNKVHDLVVEPYFERAVKGLFVRFRKQFRDGRTEYLLCAIDSVQTLDRVYTFETVNGHTVKTNKYLTLRIGSCVEAKVSVDLFSNTVPTKKEFETYAKRLQEVGQRVPVRSDVVKLLTHAKKMTSSKNKPQALPAETKANIANQEVLYPEKVNWTEQKGIASIEVGHVRTELERARQNGELENEAKFKMELERKEAKLKRIESHLPSKSNGLSRSQQLFSSMARKNEALNSENERLAASKRAMESTVGGIDPFARFDTTGMSYFSIKGQKGAKDSDGGSGAPVPVAKPSSSRHAQKMTGDWKLSLSTWRPSNVPRKTSGSATPLISAYANVISDMADFVGVSPEAKPQCLVSTSAPPVVDALYLHQVQILDDSAKLVSGKALTLQEYNRLRTE